MKWREFKQHVDGLLPKKVRFSAVDDTGASRLLFRGHADSRWTLQSTLERAGHAEMPLSHYIQMCGSARRFLSNHLPTDIQFKESCDCCYDVASRFFPNYEYLGFLRHHGFPSPLLDWTESPYVAAFFAFRSIPEGVENVRIYIYQATSTEGRSSSADEPCLFLQGPFAAIHERHATQQCWYTVCMKSRDASDCVLTPHQAGFDYGRESPCMQDSLVECDLPVSARDEAMADLFAMNITPYTLFRSVDSLVETAALRLI